MKEAHFLPGCNAKPHTRNAGRALGVRLLTTLDLAAPTRNWKRFALSKNRKPQTLQGYLAHKKPPHPKTQL